MNDLTEKCSLLGEDVDDGYRRTKYKEDWLTPDFYNIAKTWEGVLNGSNCIIYRNPDEMNFIKEKNKAWYDSLTEANVESLVLFPLKSGYELLGYIWANNFDTEKTMHIKETLELTTFFLASEISSYQMFDKFRILSTVDMLTGVLNRNEMNNRVMQLGIDDRPGRKNIGILFADLNGLKTMNDNNGHSAGDKLIKDAAAILKEVFPEAEIYRAGGDEFMVLLRGTSMEELKAYEKQMKDKAAATDNVSFAVGISLEEDSQKIYGAMKAADVAMYEDKKQFYDEHPDKKRR
jgi:diguanylate cyclase (GGDEF)-like protein